ncbi:MAG: ABC-2 type transport system permease protein [Candidatus Poriferisodalaceae bacterium]
MVTSSLSFWAVAASEATNSFTYGGQFANQYPLHLYPSWIRGVIGWTIPLAFVAYVPSIRLLDAPNSLDLPHWLAYASGPVAIATCAVAGLAWRAGIRHYQSTGS